MRFILSIVILLLLSATAINACECNIEPHSKTFRKAKAIFVGKLIEIGTEEIKKEGYSLLYKLTFDVEKKWKGKKSKQITVFTNGTNMCSAFKFREGEKYLSYVHKDSYVTSECASSKEFSSDPTQDRIKDLDSFWFRLKSRLWIF